MIDPKELEQCLVMWVNKIKGETVSIDGKTICASRGTNQKAIHMISAWANNCRMVLVQVKTEEKSNEITAIPTLLELLEIEDCVVTIYAM